MCVNSLMQNVGGDKTGNQSEWQERGNGCEKSLLCSHLPLNRTDDRKRRENSKSRIAHSASKTRVNALTGDRRRRRRFAPSLSSNSLCAPMRPCDLRDTPLPLESHIDRTSSPLSSCRRGG